MPTTCLVSEELSNRRHQATGVQPQPGPEQQQISSAPRLQQINDNSTSKLDPQRASAPSPPPPLSHDHEGLVISHGGPGAWDALRVGSPIVRRYVSDNEERWCMWYAGENTTASIIRIAVSSNGMQWRRGSAKVDTEAHGEEARWGRSWTAARTGGPSTRSTSPPPTCSSCPAPRCAPPAACTGSTTPAPTRKTCFFHPISSPLRLQTSPEAGCDLDSPSATTAAIGCAWKATTTAARSSTLARKGEWDLLVIAAPQVVFHEPGDIRMYYHSFDASTGKYSVGLARSRDAMRWLKFGKILDSGPPGSFDECGITSRHVVANPDNSGYIMVYEGVARDGKTSIGMARSEAGLLKWERCVEVPIFEPAENVEAWDGAGVGAPCLVHMDGDEWRLYYVGVSATGSDWPHGDRHGGECR